MLVKIFNRFPPSQHQFRGNNVEALKSCIQFVSYKNYSEKSDNSISCPHHGFTDHLMWASFQVWLWKSRCILALNLLKSAHPCLMWWCNFYVQEPFVGRCRDNGKKRERWAALGGSNLSHTCIHLGQALLFKLKIITARSLTFTCLVTPA